MGYDLEVDMIAAASELGLLTSPYVFDPESAEAMARAGADVLVPHMGLTTKGTIGAHTAQDARPVRRRDPGHARRRRGRCNPDVIVLCHGGPIAEPEDAAYVLDRTTGVVGLLRRVEHGAPADRGGDDREHEALQGAGAGLGVIAPRGADFRPAFWPGGQGCERVPGRGRRLRSLGERSLARAPFDQD